MVSIEGGGGQNQQKLNMYAAGCSIVASMISIIFGYGEFLNSISFPSWIPCRVLVL